MVPHPGPLKNSFAKMHTNASHKTIQVTKLHTMNANKLKVHITAADLFSCSNIS